MEYGGLKYLKELKFDSLNFRTEMEVNANQIEKTDEVIKTEEEITDLDLEIKIEKSDRKGNVKTEIFEEKSIPEPHQIIGEKRKNQEISNFENENKKIKGEFVVFEESDHEQKPDEMNQDDLNSQVI